MVELSTINTSSTDISREMFFIPPVPTQSYLSCAGEKPHSPKAPATRCAQISEGCTAVHVVTMHKMTSMSFSFLFTVCPQRMKQYTETLRSETRQEKRLSRQQRHTAQVRAEFTDMLWLLQSRDPDRDTSAS